MGDQLMNLYVEQVVRVFHMQIYSSFQVHISTKLSKSISMEYIDVVGKK